jgi:hypothetical protein
MFLLSVPILLRNFNVYDGGRLFSKGFAYLWLANSADNYLTDNNHEIHNHH